MDWLPAPYVTMKLYMFFALGFENSRYVQAIREGRAKIDTNVGTGETGRKFIGITSRVHLCLMFLFFALSWYEFGLTKSIILFGATMFIIAPLVSGLLLARLE